ncbi:MAG: cysteine synthase A [Bdellovibrionales bacterium]|jgi:cysteine synthase A
MSSARGKIYSDITETIGGTPLVRLNKLPAEAGCVGAVLAKMEFFNPLSSVKDRAALGMIEAAEKDGRLKAGSVLVEATSGNTGIGMAFIAAIRGYGLTLTMPDNMSIERRKLLAHLGAHIVLTPAKDGMAGALEKAQEIVRTNPKAVMLQQFDNPANPAIHRTTTAQEIWQDTDGHVDAFVAGVGTGGTVQGVAEGLKAHNPLIKIFAIEPAGSPVLSGGTFQPHQIQGIGANFIPANLDLALVDEIVSVSDEEAIQTAQKLAQKEGILAGISSGAAVAAALTLAKRPSMAGKIIVALLPDSAERYLSTKLFDQQS